VIFQKPPFTKKTETVVTPNIFMLINYEGTQKMKNNLIIRFD